MKHKLGPPQPGTRRRLTHGEAAVLGCAASWHVAHYSDGIWLLKPYHMKEWAGPGPRLAPVQMTEVMLRRIRAALSDYWGVRAVA